jgi:superfamily I DNA/RNA helicase
LVGDKEQSIFSFAGASLETYKMAIAKFPAHPLIVNYRSTSRIVALLNTLLEPDCRLVAAADWKDEDIPVHVLLGKVGDTAKVDAFMALRKKFGLTGNGRKPEFMVLARGTNAVRRLSSLANAKPEQGEDVFERLEERHRLLNSILRDLLRARRFLDLGEAARAFRSLDRGLSRLILKANPGFGAPEVVGLTRDSWRVMLCQVLREIRGANADEVAAWARSIQEVVKRAILNTGGKKAGPKLVLLGKLANYLKKKAKYLTVDALECVDISDEVTIAVRTIHRAKGMEAEAVLLVAGRGELTQWLNRYGSGKPRSEEARIGYVGLSRATRLLCIATDSITADVHATLGTLGAKVIDLGSDADH